MSCLWPPESCEWRSGWSTCTMKIAGTEVCPHSAALAAGCDAEEVYAISPSLDQAHALTTVSEGSGRAPLGAPSTLRVHTSRIVTDPSSLLLLDGALATTRSCTLLRTTPVCKVSSDVFATPSPAPCNSLLQSE